MKSRYEGSRCVQCQQVIRIGDEIIRGPNDYGWQHDQGDGKGCPGELGDDPYDLLDLDPDIGDR